MAELCRNAGYADNAFSNIRHGRDPVFSKVVNLGEALGLELKWVKK